MTASAKEQLREQLGQFLTIPLNEIRDHQLAYILANQMIGKNIRGDISLPGNKMLIAAYAENLLSSPHILALKKKEIAVMIDMYSQMDD